VRHFPGGKIPDRSDRQAKARVHKEEAEDARSKERVRRARGRAARREECGQHGRGVLRIHAYIEQPRSYRKLLRS
jgi:hypothetical protein